MFFSLQVSANVGISVSTLKQLEGLEGFHIEPVTFGSSSGTSAENARSEGVADP